MNTLNQKNALVCGSSQGIGQACAIELASRGANVTLVARSNETLKTTLELLPKQEGQTHSYIAVDFTDRTTLKTKIQDELSRVGAFDILVNNTGGPPGGPVFDASEDELVAGFSNHLLCNQLLAQTLVPAMKKIGGGRIINIISTSVIAPIKGLGVSNTTRGAVANWGRTLAGELAPFGITVNNVLPGYTDTQRLDTLLTKKAERMQTTRDEIEKSVLESIPMGRLGKPEEIAAMVGFLASPAASYITGLNAPVDGGRTAVQ